MQGKKAWVWGGRWVTSVVLWLALGYGVPQPVWAFNLAQSEVLEYRVHYGLLQAGTATMAYTPSAAGKNYNLVIAVRDSTILIDMNSRYTMAGVHGAKPFTSRSYHAVQKENDYRADKVVVFDEKRKQVRYTNRRDATDTAPTVTWDGQMRDVFAQLYAMRLGGLAVLKTPQCVKVMGLKTPFILEQSAAQAVAGQPKHWQVVLHTEENGQRGRDSWRITLREEKGGSLTPVKIQAQTRFGSFTAVLKELNTTSTTGAMKDRPR